MMHRPAFVTAAAFVLALTACSHPSSSPTPKESSSVTALTSNLKTRCIGRYLIDMPADAMVSGSLKVNDVAIEATAMPLDTYHKAMQARSNELHAKKSFFGYQFMYTDSVVDGVPDSHFFVSLGDEYANSDTDRLIEAYRWDNGFQIKMQIKADDARNSNTFKDYPRIKNAPAMNDASGKSGQIAELIRRAHGRADDEIPTGRGVCFQGGFITGTQLDSEEAEMDFILPDRHDVSFVLQTNTDIHETTTLLQRWKDINAYMAQDSGSKTLRKGQVFLQDMTAEEWLIKGTTDLDIPGFLFFMEANSLPSKKQESLVALKLGVGAPSRLLIQPDIDHASLDESESLALWDAVSRTLRPRPNAF